MERGANSRKQLHLNGIGTQHWTETSYARNNREASHDGKSYNNCRHHAQVSFHLYNRARQSYKEAQPYKGVKTLKVSYRQCPFMSVVQTMFLVESVIQTMFLNESFIWAHLGDKDSI